MRTVGHNSCLYFWRIVIIIIIIVHLLPSCDAIHVSLPNATQMLLEKLPRGDLRFFCLLFRQLMQFPYRLFTDQAIYLLLSFSQLCALTNSGTVPPSYGSSYLWGSAEWVILYYYYPYALWSWINDEWMKDEVAPILPPYILYLFIYILTQSPRYVHNEVECHVPTYFMQTPTPFRSEWSKVVYSIIIIVM